MMWWIIGYFVIGLIAGGIAAYLDQDAETGVAVMWLWPVAILTLIVLIPYFLYMLIADWKQNG